MAAQIHSLGPRPLYEMLAELDAGKPFHPTLEAYARLEPLADFIAALDGHEFASARLVARQRA
jgi:hypothetical protein